MHGRWVSESSCCRQLFPSTVFLLLGVPGVPDVSGPAQPGPSKRNKHSGNEIPGKTPPRLLLPFPREAAAPLVLLQGVRGAHGQGCGSADLPGPFMSPATGQGTEVTNSAARGQAGTGITGLCL